jgi:hypothetical protein
MSPPDPLARTLFRLAVGTFVSTIAGMAGVLGLAGEEPAVVVGVVGGVMLLIVLVMCLLAITAREQPGELDRGAIVQIGSMVRFRDARSGRTAQYRILPDEEAARYPHALPESSPAAQALLGAQPEERVLVVERSLVVEEVSPPGSAPPADLESSGQG